MGKVIRADYTKVFLLPPALEDWVGPDHPARFIRDFVDSLSLDKLGFKIPEAYEGRPPYATDLVLKVWLYGYMRKIRHLRPLEEACCNDLGFMWLTGTNYPDHNTLWRFWVDNEKVFKGVYRQVLYVALNCDLVGMVLHALDGTKIGVSLSKKKLWRRKEQKKLLLELEVAVAEIMAETRRNLEGEITEEYYLPEELSDATVRRDKIKKALSELDKAERDYLHPVDKEARLMKSVNYSGMAYNAQAVVDEQSGLIVAEDVVNDEADNAQLVSMISQARDNLGDVASETVADAGYYAPGELAKAEAENMSVLVNLPSQVAGGTRIGNFDKSRFKYDEKADRYICPLGRELICNGTSKTTHGQYRVKCYHCHQWRECPQREKCSSNKRGRKIDRGEYEVAVERQRLKQADTRAKEKLKKRKEVVEIVFGRIKEHGGFRQWSLRGLLGVKAQWTMICTVYNLNKLYRLWQVGKVVFA